MTPQERKVMELALEAVKPFERMFREVEARHVGSITEVNIHCQISVSDLRKCLYAAGDIKEALAQPEQEPVTLTNTILRRTSTPPQPKEPEQEPVAWVYPEGLEALKAGKPWTAYGTRQEPNNTALYLSPQPDIPPYAWVTFTPYGDEDDVWYENPEGQLLEGWTYKPLYDTTTPQRKPLTDEQIGEIGRKYEKFDNQGNEFFARWGFARAIEAAHGIKE